MLGGCNDGKQNTLDDAQAFLGLWFEQAVAADSAISAPTCHGYGELMFPSASCEDMYGHARLINPASRTLDRINALDCFGSGSQRVCGDFVEIWYRGADASGSDHTPPPSRLSRSYRPSRDAQPLASMQPPQFVTPGGSGFHPLAQSLPERSAPFLPTRPSAVQRDGPCRRAST